MTHDKNKAFFGWLIIIVILMVPAYYAASKLYETGGKRLVSYIKGTSEEQNEQRPTSNDHKILANLSSEQQVHIGEARFSIAIAAGTEGNSELNPNDAAIATHLKGLENLLLTLEQRFAQTEVPKEFDPRITVAKAIAVLKDGRESKSAIKKSEAIENAVEIINEFYDKTASLAIKGFNEPAMALSEQNSHAIFSTFDQFTNCTETLVATFGDESGKLVPDIIGDRMVDALDQIEFCCDFSRLASYNAFPVWKSFELTDGSEEKIETFLSNLEVEKQFTEIVFDRIDENPNLEGKGKKRLLEHLSNVKSSVERRINTLKSLKKSDLSELNRIIDNARTHSTWRAEEYPMPFVPSDIYSKSLNNTPSA